MPVDHRTIMPLGLLHGGASCVLAETLGSYASTLVIDFSKEKMVGLQLTANHIKSVTDGYVVGTARPVHVGRRTHVWDIRIEAEGSGALVCASRLTVAILG
jgi:1,4-dihydroxy-2-naphthoyl-CoA hydrolase